MRYYESRNTCIVRVCFFQRRYAMKKLVAAVALLVAFVAGVALQPYVAAAYKAVVTAAMSDSERDLAVVERAITLMELGMFEKHVITLLQQGRIDVYWQRQLKSQTDNEAEIAELRLSVEDMGRQLHAQNLMMQDLLVKVDGLSRALATKEESTGPAISEVETVDALPHDTVDRFVVWGAGILTSFVEHMRVLHQMQLAESKDVAAVARTPERETVHVSDGLILEVFEDGNGMLFRTLSKEQVPYGTGALALCRTHFRAETVPETAFGGVAVSTTWDKDVLCLNAITSHERNQDVVAPVLSQRAKDGTLNLDAWKRMRHGDITVPVAYIIDVASSTKTVAELVATAR